MALPSFFNRLRTLPRKYLWGGAVLLVVLIIAVVHFARGTSSTAELPPSVSHVRLASAATLSSAAGPLPVVGKVTSQSEASILSQTSGEIVVLNKKIGDHVAAGEVIARFESSAQQAAVLQAEGSYEAAQASFSKVSGSGATSASIGLSQATQSSSNARNAAVVALQSAYTAVDDAIHTKSDTIFSNPRTNSPTLNLSIPDSQLKVTIQNERAAMDQLIAEVRGFTNPSASEDIDKNIDTVSGDLRTAQTFLDHLIQAINEAIPTEGVTSAAITGYQASIGAARSEVVGALSGLTTAKNAYDSAVAGTQTAANTAGQGLESDIASAQANVKVAQGALSAARSNLEKTVVRSPISGTVVSLPISRGDYIGAFQPVAQVSNPNALEIMTYVTPEDAKTFSVGGKATIEETTSGVIVSIAPAIDPTTGKIEVKIGIPGNQSGLNSGESVAVTLERSTTQKPTGPAGQAQSLTIPIVAVKITPTGPVVFTVSSSTLQSHAITLGAVLGDQVKVQSGLTPDMIIVTDARSLADGQTVIVDSE